MKNADILKKDGVDVLKASLAALLISLAAVLVFALIVRWASLEDTAITVGNYVIKAVALLIGITVCFRNPHAGALKGLITGVIYMLLCVFVFAVSDGFKSANFNFADFLTTAIAGTLSGIIAVNLRHSPKT